MAKTSLIASWGELGFVSNILKFFYKNNPRQLNPKNRGFGNTALIVIYCSSLCKYNDEIESSSEDSNFQASKNIKSNIKCHKKVHMHCFQILFSLKIFPYCCNRIFESMSTEFTIYLKSKSIFYKCSLSDSYTVPLRLMYINDVRYDWSDSAYWCSSSSLSSVFVNIICKLLLYVNLDHI